MLKVLGLVFLGVAVFLLSYQYSRRFLDWLRFQSLGTRDFIVEKLSYMFIEVPPNKILMGLFSISIGFGSLAFLITLPHVEVGIPLGLVIAFIAWKVPKPIVNFLYKKRIEKFVFQMVDGLNLMSNGLKSGLSVVQALGLAVTEMPNPLKQEFNLVLSQNKVGVSLEEAFNSLSKRVPADDVEMFVTSVNILKETGGNLAETLDTIVTTIRERVKVEKKIAAMTAQGFYQGVLVMAIPPILGTIFYQTDPDFMMPLFTTPVGWLIILVIILLEVVGFFVIMRLIKIDV